MKEQQNNNEQTLIDQLIEHSQNVSMADYGEFIKKLAEYCDAGLLNGIERNKVVTQLVQNEVLGANKRLINQSIDKEIKDLQPKIEHNESSEQFTLKDDGVYYTGYDKEGLPLPPKLICSSLLVQAKTADEYSYNHGVLLEWTDDRNIKHSWAMPKSLLASDGTDIARELLDRGLYIKHGQKARVIEYIQSAIPNKSLTCVTTTGWHKDVYVTPRAIYGRHADNYIFQPESPLAPTTPEQGTLEDWQQHISCYAIGNSRLILALCLSFAAPLLRFSDNESGGIHLYGSSSDGKTLTQQVAATVYAKPSDKTQTWRATSNGLEAIASQNNDNILFLDEIKQATGKDIDEILYMLGNGQGKARANKSGNARHTKKWQLLALSTGEITPEDMLKAENKDIHTGQEVRFANIPSDTGKGFGVFESLHNFESSALLAEALQANTNKYYGTVGKTWLQILTKDYEQLLKTIPSDIREYCNGLGELSSQSRRVARRFALCVVAGELATKHGLTQWQEGEASKAATQCFNEWLDSFGRGNREEQQIYQSAISFLESNPNRFHLIIKTHHKSYQLKENQSISNRVGYKYEEGKLLILASQISELAPKHPKAKIIQALHKRGLITETKAKSERIPTEGVKRVYHVTLSENVTT